MHYSRWRKHGNPLETRRRTPFNFTKKGVGYIDLGNNCFALCDIDDFENLSKNTWSRNAGGYATRTENFGSARKCVFMHRQILSVEGEKFVDHINHNVADNRKSNLRIVTHSQNQLNRVSEGEVPYKGVKINKTGKRVRRFAAYIKQGGRQRFLGHFLTPEEAASVYDCEAQKEFGEFAFLNFPEDSRR